MELNELTSSLRDISNMRSASHFKRTTCKMAAQRLEAQQTRIAQLEAELKEERRWIPVEERLPEPDKQVLAIVSGRWENITFDRAYELMSWSSDEGWIREAWPELEDPEVTHWKPLPEPPEEVG